MISYRIPDLSHSPRVHRCFRITLAFFGCMILGLTLVPLEAQVSEYNYWSGPGPSLRPSDWDVSVEDFNGDGYDDLFFTKRDGTEFYGYLAFNNGVDGFNGDGSRWFSSVSGDAPNLNADPGQRVLTVNLLQRFHIQQPVAKQVLVYFFSRREDVDYECGVAHRVENEMW